MIPNGLTIFSLSNDNDEDKTKRRVREEDKSQLRRMKRTDGHPANKVPKVTITNRHEGTAGFD